MSVGFKSLACVLLALAVRPWALLYGRISVRCTCQQENVCN
jgi:hypothetical protein